MFDLGQRVVCIDDQFAQAVLLLGYLEFPVKDRAYTVRQMMLGRDWVAALGPDGRPVQNPDQYRSAEPAVLLTKPPATMRKMAG